MEMRRTLLAGRVLFLRTILVTIKINIKIKPFDIPW